MRDLDPLHYFLGIEVALSFKGYLPSQFKYITNVFNHGHLFNNKVMDISIKTNA